MVRGRRLSLAGREPREPDGWGECGLRPRSCGGTGSTLRRRQTPCPASRKTADCPRGSCGGSSHGERLPGRRSGSREAGRHSTGLAPRYRRTGVGPQSGCRRGARHLHQMWAQLPRSGRSNASRGRRAHHSRRRAAAARRRHRTPGLLLATEGDLGPTSIRATARRSWTSCAARSRTLAPGQSVGGGPWAQHHPRVTTRLGSNTRLARDQSRCRHAG